MILFHKTSAAAAPKILSGGFIDAEGSFGMVGLDEPLRGVWVSDLPLHAGNGMHDPDDPVLLEVTLDVPEPNLAAYEVREDWGNDSFSHREWCVPAALLNDHGALRIVGEDEQCEFDDPRRWFRMPTSETHPRFIEWRRSRGFESGGIVDEQSSEDDLSLEPARLLTWTRPAPWSR